MSLPCSIARFLLALVFTINIFSSSSTLFAQEAGSEAASVADTVSPQGAVAGPAATAGNGLPTEDAVIAEGETIFKANCTACHAVDAQVVGPALKDIHQRRPLPWIISFVHNSQKVIESGDSYAVDLFNKFNKVAMPAFDQLTDAQITAVVAYIAKESAGGGKKTDDQVGGDQQAGTGDAGAAGDGGSSSAYLTIIIAVLVVVLLLVLIVLALVASVLTKVLRQRNDLDESDREVVNKDLNVKKLLTSKGFLGIFTFVLLVVVLKAVIDGMYSIGVQQGYAPVKPIAFSHKLHAGQYQIDCNYCHTGVRKSKNANIPSPNICMNCHVEVKKESPEIKKIYAAIENNKPIEWIRVHNLPDLAYFNHSQHVKVGTVECQTCHGPIQEMDVVRQHAPLTMGWCVNCHRETEVKTADNPYYDKLVEFHSSRSKEAMKVKDMGGLECAKCHY